LGFPHLIRDPHEIAIRDGVYPQVPQAVTKKAGELANSNPLDLTWIGKNAISKRNKNILQRHFKEVWWVYLIEPTVDH
jgi:hypothetical protein